MFASGAIIARKLMAGLRSHPAAVPGVLLRHGVVLLAGKTADWWFGIDTYHLDTSPVFADDVGYDPTKYGAIQRVQQELRLGPKDVFFDIGCGRGRVVCMISRERLKACIGIECNPEHALAARRNAERVRGRRTPIEIRLQDATQADYRGGTVFFFYNPFGEHTMTQVVDRISLATEPHTGAVRIVYANPLHAHVLDATGWLRRVRTFDVPYQPGKATQVVVWQSP